MQTKKIVLKILFAVVGAVFFGGITHAAVLTIAPQGNNIVAITLDTQGESINAIELHLSFNPESFSIQNVNDGGSIVNFWVTPPTFSNASGTADLSGITPGGITTASGTVATIQLAQGEQVGSSFTVVSASALLNDGKGTPAALSIVDEPFTLFSSTASSTGSSTVDTQAPDPFTPEVAHDPNIFNGQYFLVFSTTDEQSGINHYEVLESRIGTWVPTPSPYLLQDQTLSSDIYVRAIDNAGNFRVVELPAGGLSARSPFLNDITFALLMLLLIVIFTFLLWQEKPKTAR